MYKATDYVLPKQRHIDACFIGMIKWLLAGILCFSSIGMVAQVSTTETENYIRINYDNDLFTKTDRYYTQGIRIEFINSSLQKSPFSYLFFRSGKNARNYFGLGVNQNVYTPRNINQDSITHGERPYAGTLFLSGFLISLNDEKHIRLSSQLNLGVIGPPALGAQGQKFVHRVFSNSNAQPIGWENQIATDAVVNYNMQLEKGFINTTYFELIGITGARIGTLNNDASAGLMLRTGLLLPYFNTLGLYRHAVKKADNFQLYLYMRAKGNVVAYDATLQGGMFNRNSNYVLQGSDIKRLTAAFSAGLVFSYKQFGAEFSTTYSTPQFTKGIYNAYGHIGVFICY